MICEPKFDRDGNQEMSIHDNSIINIIKINYVCNGFRQFIHYYIFLYFCLLYYVNVIITFLQLNYNYLNLYFIIFRLFNLILNH